MQTKSHQENTVPQTRRIGSWDFAISRSAHRNAPGGQESKSGEESESIGPAGGRKRFDGLRHCGYGRKTWSSPCQAVTELAAEKHASISPKDFRTFNRCLDNAIEPSSVISAIRIGQTFRLGQCISSTTKQRWLLSRRFLELRPGPGQRLAGLAIAY